MAEKQMNVLQKLAEARLRFLNEHIKKSGKNIKLEFTYFELKDIVPSATKIFADLGISTVVKFSDGYAAMLVMNADNPAEEGIEFCIPYKEAPQIISNAGKEVTNPLQALGATITYLRRYLYMLVLDIVEDDATDASLGDETPAPAQKKPATPAERKKVKETLTKAPAQPAPEKAMASAEDMAVLKDLCKQVMGKDENNRTLVTEIALKSNAYTALPAEACTQLIDHLQGILKAYEGKE